MIVLGLMAFAGGLILLKTKIASRGQNAQAAS
jgi:hypothetical protein